MSYDELFISRSSMSGHHLVKKGREHRKMDQRDFTVASPAEFVTRFGGNRVIEKVRMTVLDFCFNDPGAVYILYLFVEANPRVYVSVTGADS